MCSVLFDKTILNAPRVALGIISGKIILNFGALKSLRTFQSTFFTRGVHEKEMAQQKPRSLVRRSGAFDLLLIRAKKEKEKGERSICHAGRWELCRSSRAAAAAGTAEKLVERYSTSCSAA